MAEKFDEDAGRALFPPLNRVWNGGTRETAPCFPKINNAARRKAAKPDLRRVRLRVEGRVQGVGFRPCVYRLARRCGLTGFVRNTGFGVLIEAQGASGNVNRFISALQSEKPSQAVIEVLNSEEINLWEAEKGFVITKSVRSGDMRAGMPPDLAVCALCRRDVFDAKNRRRRYPFTNCTDCGPRFSIIRALPYDRQRTTMASFKMCPECLAEFRDPGNRRFEAQPNACPVCGPRLRLLDAQGNPVEGEALDAAVQLLKAGKILAVKGIGGYHLCCGALNEKAVRLLRERKNRPDKSFAVMFNSLRQVRKYCRVTPAEEAELQSVTAPIVVLKKRKGKKLAGNISPDTADLGVFLPYAPLHCLLLEEISPLIMTSGNRRDEPIAIKEEDLKGILGGIADAVLVHDREIIRRCDDSVLKLSGGERIMFRRSRGFVPAALPLPVDGPPVLACGAELKNTVCVTRGGRAFLSAHIGDMDDARNYAFFRETVRDFLELLEIKPAVVACDMHPDYVSTRYALGMDGVRLEKIQHHHAHVAACMAENLLAEKVIGVALDGTGFGPDGSIWGGEILLADLCSFQRAGHFKPYPMPGGARAIMEPERMAMSVILSEFGPSAEKIIRKFLPSIPARALSPLMKITRERLHSPLTSSAGRLFDAVAALFGLGQGVSYEGRPAVRLQALADRTIFENYPYAVQEENGIFIISCAKTIRAVIAALKRKTAGGRIAAMFHNTLAAALAEACVLIRRREGLNRVALSGGVFQNDFLLERLLVCLEKEKFEVYTHRAVPPNDGGISLGQAVVAAARSVKKNSAGWRAR